LRNVLMRLRQSSGDIVVRDGDVLAFADRVEVDALRFSALADVALAPGDPSARLAAAVEALASYRGDLLSEAPYEQFAVAPRERLRWRALELLDFIGDVAERRGDFDEAVRAAQRAVQLQPYDESWFVRLARLLAAQGRRASARAVIERGRAVAVELGVPPASELVEIEASLDQG
jgi:DNA-binding SARP family transcriptional activator